MTNVDASHCPEILYPQEKISTCAKYPHVQNIHMCKITFFQRTHALYLSPYLIPLAFAKLQTNRFFLHELSQPFHYSMSLQWNVFIFCTNAIQIVNLSHKHCFKCIKNHGFFTHKVDGQPQNFPFKLLVPGFFLFDFAPQYMSSFLGEGYSVIDIEFSVN